MMRTSIYTLLQNNLNDSFATSSPIANPPNTPHTLPQFKALAASKPVQNKVLPYAPNDSDKNRIHKSNQYCLDNEPILRQGMEDFCNMLTSIHNEAVNIFPDYKSNKINYVERLQRHVLAVIKENGTAAHDMNIIVSQTLCAIQNKLVRHLIYEELDLYHRQNLWCATK